MKNSDFKLKQNHFFNIIQSLKKMSLISKQRSLIAFFSIFGTLIVFSIKNSFETLIVQNLVKFYFLSKII